TCQMDVFGSSENTFHTAHLSKPKKIIEIPTNAPVQTRHDEVGYSSGSFTFPADSHWRDRFIVWRATGTVLILEERSVRHTVLENCIAFNFSRAPIVPGTHISLVSNVLLIVVTTQSSVHRFTCRLAFDSSDSEIESVESTLAHLLDVVMSKDLVRGESHDVHQLAARSTPAAAAVVIRPEDTRVAVSLGDGELVIVTIGNGMGSKSDEMPITEAGFMQRFVGKTRNGVMGVCASTEIYKRSEIKNDVDFTPFYTVNKDLSIRIVNGETYQTAFSVEFKELVSLIGDVVDASIRWNNCGSFGVILVAITTTQAVHFLILRDVERTLEMVAETRIVTTSRLVDFGVHAVAKDLARLWIVTGSGQGTVGGEAEAEEKKDEDAIALPSDVYALEYMNLHVPCVVGDGNSPHVGVSHSWIKVRGAGETRYERFSLRQKLRLDSSSVSSSAARENSQMLRKEVFNVDNHQFDVVLRAVRITTDNPSSSSFFVVHNDWASLISAVDTYIRSAEFERKFVSSDWSTSSGVTARDGRVEAETRFYRALSSSCSEIERSMSRPIGLFIAPVAGSNLVGVIQETSTTVVVESCGQLVERLSREQKETLLKALEEARNEEAKPISSPREKERAAKRSRNAFDEMDEDNEEILSEAVELFVRRAKGVMSGRRGDEEDEDEMEEDSSSDNSPTSLNSDQLSDMNTSPYGGSFTAGLVNTVIRTRIMDDYKIASRLIRLMENRRVNLEEHREDLKELVRTLGVLIAQLDMYVDRENGGTDSLAGWLFSPQSLPLLRVEGGYETEMSMYGDEEDDRPPLHTFIDRSVISILSAINPLSPSQAIPKLLAVRDKHETIKGLYTFWGCQLPPTLKYVVAYYSAIALSGTGMPRKALDHFKEAANGMRMGDK
ncbi:hypothetical protein PFISCL1PPCAC_20368, partial [Pristionchus fissidentatus]